MDGKKSSRIDGLSKLTKIEDLREKLVDIFDAKTDCQKLFFRGKQLVDGHTLFDYKVGLNEIIQIIVSTKSEEPLPNSDNSDEDKENIPKDTNVVAYSKEDDKDADKEDDKEAEKEADKDENKEIISDVKSNFKVGDIIDIKDPSLGAWFEGKINNVKMTQKDGAVTINYDITYDNDDVSETVLERFIRPRARRTLAYKDLNVGDVVMLNYNYDKPADRGYWYDAEITSLQDNKVTASIYLRETQMEKCVIKFSKEMFAIETNDHVTNENDEDRPIIEKRLQIMRTRVNAPICEFCKDNERRKCKKCQCCKCGDRRDPDRQVLCDECDDAYHLDCLDPPLDELPSEDEWYCPDCKNDTDEVVKPGEKLKKSAKTAKMVSATSKTTRDWGRGMACVGRSSINTMVPSNHIGPVPGVEVGMCWRFRVQVSESGCHRPHVAGISGRESDGAFSLVLSGGYEDDIDEGDQFTYTGSGGRDLSGNKRTAAQSSDQLLTRMNKALAMSCAVPVDEDGAEAKNWRQGQPIRVIRSMKGRKHSKYAPEEGNRYDGIYKIVKYWQSVGKSGFKVWRYMLRRDDETPAPWTKAGKKRIQRLGFTVQYPDGYLESQKAKQAEEDTKPKKRKRKNKGDDSEDDDAETESKTVKITFAKDKYKELKAKKSKFEIEGAIQKLIKRDLINKKRWDVVLGIQFENYNKFLAEVEQQFSCICCQDIVLNPLIILCSHVICETCLKRSFEASVFNCPTCRYQLGEGLKMTVNVNLSAVLHKLYPNYHTGR